ncbi:MAG: apolipoprotein N-acyltransferase, partial [Actinobacteria bacterium]|nr:apolipoprotein N-acyltransferase [Actinomycetota bacterium]
MWQRTPARFAAAVLAGLLLSAARPPLDLGPLALVALVPLWFAWRGTRPGRAALLGLVGGVAYYGVLVSWTWYFGAVAIVPFVVVLALSWAGAGAVVAWLAGRGVRNPWVLGAIWVLFEAVIGRFPVGGFYWGEVGYAFHASNVARGLATWGGVPFVSFVAVAGSALFADGVIAAASRNVRALGPAAAGLAVLVAVVAVGDVTRFTPHPTGSLHYALLQGNDKDRELTQAEVDAQYLTYSHLGLAAQLEGPYDLIVFPESSLDSDPEDDITVRNALVDVARSHGADVLANAITTDAQGRNFNTNRLYEPNGKLQGSYSKQHLVPFGEYIPLQSIFGSIGATKQIKTLFTAGHGTKIFHVAGHPVGTVICFESAFSPLVRKFVRAGAQAIVVTTNNRSYRRSANSAQHLDTSQMRAAETARPVLHSAISGITAVFDASGHELHHTRLFHNTVVTGRITTTSGE